VGALLEVFSANISQLTVFTGIFKVMKSSNRALLRSTKLVNGKWLELDSGARLVVHDLATSELVAEGKPPANSDQSMI